MGRQPAAAALDPAARLAGLLVSLVLLLLTAFFGVERNGNTELAGARARSSIQPSEIAKLALVLWAAHVYANKDRRLGEHPPDR